MSLRRGGTGLPGARSQPDPLNNPYTLSRLLCSTVVAADVPKEGQIGLNGGGGGSDK